MEHADGPIAEERQEEIVAQLEAQAVMLDHGCCFVQHFSSYRTHMSCQRSMFHRLSRTPHGAGPLQPSPQHLRWRTPTLA